MKVKRKRSDHKELEERILEKAKHYVKEKDVEEESDDDDDKSDKRKATDEHLKVKREKNRLKKLRKRQVKRGEVELPTGQGKELALQYLKLWRDYNDIWKFQKIRQNWLLKHMYETKKISDSDFEILLQYLASMQGAARDRTLQEAEDRIKKYDDASNTDGKDAQIYGRARRIVQLLV